MLFVARVGKCRWSINSNDTATSNITHPKNHAPHENGNGYNYNSRIHIIQTLPLPLPLLFSSELFLTTKVKMSRKNQTFYRCKFMKSQKPRTQKKAKDKRQFFQDQNKKSLTITLHFWIGKWVEKETETLTFYVIDTTDLDLFSVIVFLFFQFFNTFFFFLLIIFFFL